ncbi:DNA polymerase III subunit delta [Methylopila jiangsuensis]|uniref:DNA-directed DNA polymerase n=1 Tax=Methylopila jiangsuensis TaxID=586230 RepID=A0A9W6JIM7_9HYPH|nr:DNA polymerase III subunit delta [Methylopila jiangsuensis]MDR6284890.1 DNA polymerase-3 subunit delta [Methylopila jiangsuensis]GLK77722.1 DNA polymerase III subunit delta [Methylopila jiangsuensis]
MVAIKASGVDAFLARPPAEVCAVLIYGPDAGLVAERAERLAARALEGSDDPFALVRLEGDDVASDPGRLADEARTIALFGGKRLIRVKVGGRALNLALEGLLGGPQPDALTLLEAGDLKKTNPLRTLCEKSPRAAALPCYPDEAGARERLIDEELRAAGLGIAPEARALLSASLGPDRLAARGEVRKLCLYAMGQSRIEADDVAAVIPEAGDVGQDAAVDAAFAGRAGDLVAALKTLRANGTPPSVVVGAALRHALTLHRLRADVEAGRGARQVMEANGFLFHFRRKDAAEKALGAWTGERLEQTIVRLGDAVAAGRRTAGLGEAVAERVLLGLAIEAARRPR